MNNKEIVKIQNNSMKSLLEKLSYEELEKLMIKQAKKNLELEEKISQEVNNHD